MDSQGEDTGLCAGPIALAALGSFLGSGYVYLPSCLCRLPSVALGNTAKLRFFFPDFLGSPDIKGGPYYVSGCGSRNPKECLEVPTQATYLLILVCPGLCWFHTGNPTSEACPEPQAAGAVGPQPQGVAVRRCCVCVGAGAAGSEQLVPAAAHTSFFLYLCFLCLEAD